MRDYSTDGDEGDVSSAWNNDLLLHRVLERWVHLRMQWEANRSLGCRVRAMCKLRPDPLGSCESMSASQPAMVCHD